MVDTTSCGTMANQHVVAADKWWSNMLAVIKLRQKGTTKVSRLPSGVFRHILQYKIPNEFSFRYS